MDSSGNVTGGTVVTPDGTTFNVTGGSITIDNEGILGGSVTTSAATMTLRHGKMDQGKSIMSWTDTIGSLYYHTGVFVKAGGTFSTSDLAGTWHGYWGEINSGFDQAVWFYGTIVLDSAGNAIGGTYYQPDGSTRTIVGGQLGITSAGILSGTVTTSNGSIITLRHGKMDPGKGFLGWSDIDNDGYYHNGWLVKSGGTFTTSDLTGTWYGYWGQIDPTFTTFHWFYGTIILDSDGNAVGGTYYPLDGSPRTIVDGQLGITSDGILSGSVTTSNGSIITLRHGKMHAQKTMLSWTDIDDDGYYHTGWLTLGGAGQGSTTATMPWIPLLLLDDNSGLSQLFYNSANGHWYQLNDNLLTYSEAQFFAEQRGGYLATITSADEGQWIYDTFGDDLVAGHRRLGGDDIDVEGQWQWATGEAWSYTNWYSGEPNNYEGSEDCVAFHPYVSSGRGNYWNDVPCDLQYSSIIEYESQP
jgi:hypothetical protein